MKKSLVITTLFFGFLIATFNAEAKDPHGNNNLEGMNDVQNNPWDPREANEEGADATDAAGQGGLQQSEEESESE